MSAKPLPKIVYVLDLPSQKGKIRAMEFPRFSRLVLTLGACLATVSVASAEDIAPPYVAKPITNVTVPAGSGASVVSLKKTFKLTGISGSVVRFTTSLGTVDVGLLSQETPQTVAAFLKDVTVTGDNTTGVVSYNNTLIQRAVHNFIVQGGGFYVDSQSAIDQITGRPTIPSEAGIKNTRGTIAMALPASGPGNATGEWFFNVVDNAVLDDTSDGGPFTVFGKVVGSLATVDAIEAAPQYDLSGSLGGGFQNVPTLPGTTSSQISIQDLVYTKTIAPIAIVAKKAGVDSILGLKIKNSNHGLVTAKINGNKLELTPISGETGTAKIRVIARNKTSGAKATAAFTYTVE